MLSVDYSRLHALLVQGVDDLGLVLTEKQLGQLVDYVITLKSWNKTYNLTAVRDVEEMMKRHVLDSLSIINEIRLLTPRYLADIGTGAGVPGIVLAIAMPEVKIYLLESIGKKCRFLRQVVQQLGLSQVMVVQQRVEQWRPDFVVDVIICRAFSSLLDFVLITDHLGDKNSVWLAMKSTEIEKEKKALVQQGGFDIVANQVLYVPFEEAGRQLIVLKKQTKEN